MLSFCRLNDLGSLYERTRNDLTDKEKSLRGLQQSQVRNTFGDRSALGLANGGEEEALRQVIGDAQQVYKVLAEAAGQQSDEVDAQHVTEASAETTSSGLRRPKTLQLQLPQLPSADQQAAGSRPQSALFTKSSPLAARLSGQSLAEQALSSVQSAFNKRQLQVQELITKLSNARENLNAVRKCDLTLTAAITQISCHCSLVGALDIPSEEL